MNGALAALLEGHRVQGARQHAADVEPGHAAALPARPGLAHGGEIVLEGFAGKVKYAQLLHESSKVGMSEADEHDVDQRAGPRRGSGAEAAGCGLLGLAHRDVPAVAERFVERTHLNPAKHYPHIFIEAASRLTDGRLWMLAWLALCYATLRCADAWGPWRERAWAEWFAVVSGGIYRPIELYKVAAHLTWVRLCTLLVTLGIVAYMAWALRQTRRVRHTP
jgi:uncharacterized membrane protein (DUF2068 family)